MTATAEKTGETLTRPNGQTFRPRKVAAHFVYEDEIEDGVMVLGTHSVERARRLADELVRAWDGNCMAVDPVTGWHRDGFDGGQRRWIYDAEHGRASVWFRAIAEASREITP